MGYVDGKEYVVSTSNCIGVSSEKTFKDEASAYAYAAYLNSLGGEKAHVSSHDTHSM